MAPFEIHVSDLAMFRQCRRKWYLGSREQQNLESIVPKMALWLGTGVHFGLEMYNGSLIRGMDRDAAADNMIGAFQDWCKGEIERIEDTAFGLMPEQEYELEDSIALGTGMLSHYAVWCPEEDATYGLQYIDTEVSFDIPLTDDIHLAGRFDGLVKTQDGKLWVLENKTAKTIFTDHLLLDEQAGGYVLAAREVLGLDVQGILYNFLRKKLPGCPKINKNGSVSKQKVDTTYEVYRDTLLEEGISLDDPDVVDTLEFLRLKGNTFFKRQFVTRSASEISELRDRFVKIGREMKRAIPEQAMYPSPNRTNCLMCQFPAVCLAIAGGADWKLILDTYYRKKEESRTKIDWEEED